VFWVLLATALWLLSGVVAFLTILLGAWRYSRRDRLEITSRQQQVSGGLRAPRAASSAREREHGEDKPRRSLGLGWLLGILQPYSAPASLGQRVNLVLGSGTPVKVAAALGVAPLVLLPSPVIDRGRDGGPVRVAASRQASSSAPLDRVLSVSFGIAALNSSTHWARVTVLTTGTAPTNTPPGNQRAEAAAPMGGGATLVETDSRTSPISDPSDDLDAVSTDPDGFGGKPPAGDATGASVAPLPRRQPAGKGGEGGKGNPSIAISPTDQDPPEQITAPPVDPASQGSGSPPDPGSQSHGHGPPADPGSQAESHGPPADPGSQAESHGPPADPGSQAESHGPPADPGSQTQSPGPPADAISQANGSTAEPGTHGQSNSPSPSQITSPPAD
jgi:hypothetical protein